MKKHLLAAITVGILFIPILVILGYYKPDKFGFMVVNVLFIVDVYGAYSLLKSRRICKSERRLQLLLMLLFPPYILHVLYK